MGEGDRVGGGVGLRFGRGSSDIVCVVLYETDVYQKNEMAESSGRDKERKRVGTGIREMGW